MIPIDDKRGQKYNYDSTGYLYMHRDPDQLFTPSFMKKNDAGIDIPVKINIDQVKFGRGHPTPDKLRVPMLYPDLKHNVFPNGRGNDKRPFLDVPALGWAEVPAGISVKLPDNSWGLLISRSSTTWKKHLITIPSVIDSGYTGLLGTLVYNPNHVPVPVYEYDPETKKGDCLSQLIIMPKYDLKGIVLVDSLPDTERGKTGFGSSRGT